MSTKNPPCTTCPDCGAALLPPEEGDDMWDCPGCAFCCASVAVLDTLKGVCIPMHLDLSPAELRLMAWRGERPKGRGAEVLAALSHRES